ncbi:hypothetical protein L1049_003975 [Liquidambar formosana]|uniref:Myb-like domain-containing protein n=1 Tax=Liquidambar formosana TaxID=63359 RepID=A0AAP0RMM0_LIQFO
MATTPSSSPPLDPDPTSPPSPSPSNQTSPKPLHTSSPQKRPQPLPWSHQETTHLIQAYQEKWYSLKKGQLKASQWEEVAVTVAARCGYDEPSKTATQCRHKIEKLRKRYRTEKQRLGPGYGYGSGSSRLSSWQFFDLMDRMERGPLPISVRPMTMVKCENSFDLSDDDDHEEDSDNDDRFNNKSRSINYILRRPSVVNRFAADRKLGEGGTGGSRGGSRFLPEAVVQRRREAVEDEDEDEDDDNDENEEEEEGGRRGLSELAAEVRAFAERFVRMENKKMEMMKESERQRMEMENKRMDMILDSQRKIVDTIGRALGSHKKLKMTQEI